MYINVFYSDFYYYESIYVTFKLQESDSVTNRVAGFICKYVFSEHESCVTSLVVIERNKDLNSTYVVSLYMGLVMTKPVFAFLKKRDSNQSPQQQRLDRKLKFHLKQA